MVWAPNPATREKVKFWLDCLQVFTVAASIAAVAITYITYKAQEADQIRAQNDRAEEQQATADRELRKPYDEKQLRVYVETASVLAHLATTNNQSDPVENRFWELYWGELPFFESMGQNSVSEMVNRFCIAKFGADRCSKSPQSKEGATNSPIQIAIDMSEKASSEIKGKWQHSQ